MKKQLWYVGIKTDQARIPFKSGAAPTKETHGNLYAAVIGPFRTRRVAEFDAAVPHIQHVRDAERIAKEVALQGEPVVVVSHEIAEAFGMAGLPNVIVIP